MIYYKKIQAVHKRADITNASKVIYTSLILSGRDDLTDKELMELCGITAKITVMKNIKRLEDKGVITRVKIRGKRHFIIN